MTAFRPFLFVLLLLGSSVFVSGQSIQGQIAIFKDSKSYSAVYDKFKDETTVTVEAKVKDNGKPRNKLDNLKLTAMFTFPGQELKKNVDAFAIQLSAESRQWRFLRSHRLIILTDSTKIDNSDGKHDGSIISGGRVSERIFFGFRRTDFENTAHAKTVELQLGGYEGFIDAENLEKLRNFFALATVK